MTTKTKLTKEEQQVNKFVKETKLLVTSKQIDAAILEAQSHAMTTQEKYHLIASSILCHLYLHKDILVTRRMLDGMPAGLRINAMKAYLERFGQVRFLTAGDLLTPKYKDLEEGLAVYDNTKSLKLGEMLETPWYKASNEPVYKPLDLDAMIKNVIRLADARLKKGASEAKGDKLDQSKLDKLKALVA